MPQLTLEQIYTFYYLLTEHIGLHGSKCSAINRLKIVLEQESNRSELIDFIAKIPWALLATK